MLAAPRTNPLPGSGAELFGEFIMATAETKRHNEVLDSNESEAWDRLLEFLAEKIADQILMELETPRHVDANRVSTLLASKVASSAKRSK